MSPVATLRTVPFLARASDAGLARLAAASVERHFSRGDFLFRHGEPVERIFVIRSGRVAATVFSREGAQLTYHIGGPGETAGHSSLFDPAGHQASAQALGEVTAVAVPAAQCLDLLAAEAPVAFDYARDLAGIIRILDESMADLVFLNLERRLARTLADAASVGNVITLAVSQGQLAAQLGSARQSVNQALGRLTQRGLIRIDTPRTIRLVDRDALLAFIDDLD